MRKTFLVLAGYITLSLLSACTFTDDEFYRADPVADDPSVVSVLSNLDTLYQPKVNDSLLVIYEVSVENGEFYFMDALVSARTVHSSDTSSGSFWVYPSQSNETDLDTLYMDIYHSSNTNTLADRIGYEAATTRQNYIIDFSKEVKK